MHKKLASHLNILFPFADESGADSENEEDTISPTSSINEKRSLSSPDLDADNLSKYNVNTPFIIATSLFILYLCISGVDDLPQSVYDPPLELQLPSAVELSDSPLPSPASSASTDSDLNSPEFQPSSIVSQHEYSNLNHHGTMIILFRLYSATSVLYLWSR